MNQQSQMHPFDYAKHKIADSSNKLYKYLLWTVFIAIAMFIVIIISIVVILGSSLADLDPNDLYGMIEALFTGGAVVIALVVIAGLALIIILIMTYIQYYKLGSGFSFLHKADPINDYGKNASYGIQGYIVAIILGIFVPGIGGTVISLIGNASLALGFYFVYRLFVDYQNKGRFNKKPPLILFIAVCINLITSIVSFFTLFGPIGNIIGFIMLVYGFRDLSKDITFVQPPTGGPARDQPVQSQTPSVSVAAQTETSPSTGAQFCSSCGAKVQSGVKFCENCGANI
ncbi:MAG: zinc ribbon domain-containing protein [Candidatus Heimdallarchaeota archaeon]|nr:zinc ribbon domain-containing protein [Candidatus Heimdallarchaeota archaeon]MCK4878518.1 zinc ribbon domain-containing protein [Candidatus Heimdallarchaeota archaeon]